MHNGNRLATRYEVISRWGAEIDLASPTRAAAFRAAKHLPESSLPIIVFDLLAHRGRTDTWSRQVDGSWQPVNQKH